MSYMYSGYGNSGYEYDRGDRGDRVGSYYDRYAARPDPRDISMYPTKKDLIQTGAVRIDHEERARWSWCLTIMSLIVTTLCFPPFGLIGYSFVSHAYADHKSGDNYHVTYKRKCAWGWSITGLVVGILGWLTLIVIYALIWSGQWAVLLKG